MKKLHFGCFDQVHEGWINTDITPHLWISKVPKLPDILNSIGKMSEVRLKQHEQGIFKKIKRLDITKTFPFIDNEFICAFSSHVIEHLYTDQARFCLKEVHRILVKGGILRLALPDLDKVVKQYDLQNPDDFCKGIFESGQLRDKNRHHWMYNEISLKRLLLEVGFEKVYRCEYQKGNCPEVDKIDNRPDISLFMEAVK